MMRYTCCLALVLVFLAGCTKAKVETVYDSQVDFTALNTYSWMVTEDGPSSDERVSNPEVDSTVRTAVDSVLKDKGYKRMGSSGEKSDFLISWFGAIDTMVRQESIDKFYSSYGYGAVAAVKPASVQTDVLPAREYEKGTILLEFLDTKSGKIIWRGRSSDRLRQGMKKEEAVLYVERLVRQMLKDFPGK